MKLWLLGLTEAGDEWWPSYDAVYGVVVVAATEGEARALAAGIACDEARRLEGEDGNPWLDARWTTCVELIPGDKARVVLTDFRAG